MASMKFRLFYRGPLKANGLPDHKHEIRKAFHPQLKTLATQNPMKDFFDSLSQEVLVKRRGDFKFLPLVQHELELIAAIDIVLLRPEEPGNLITQGGDIDNRLKTLLDSLQMPPDMNQLPSIGPTQEEEPFYCLLEGDNLVTSLSVGTDRLLAPSENPNEVILLIQVMLEFTHQHFTNVINRPAFIRSGAPSMLRLPKLPG